MLQQMVVSLQLYSKGLGEIGKGTQMVMIVPFSLPDAMDMVPPSELTRSLMLRRPNDFGLVS